MIKTNNELLIHEFWIRRFTEILNTFPFEDKEHKAAVKAYCDEIKKDVRLYKKKKGV